MYIDLEDIASRAGATVGFTAGACIPPLAAYEIADRVSKNADLGPFMDYVSHNLAVVSSLPAVPYTSVVGMVLGSVLTSISLSLILNRRDAPPNSSSNS